MGLPQSESKRVPTGVGKQAAVGLGSDNEMGDGSNLDGYLVLLSLLNDWTLVLGRTLLINRWRPAPNTPQRPMQRWMQREAEDLFGVVLDDEQAVFASSEAPRSV